MYGWDHIYQYDSMSHFFDYNTMSIFSCYSIFFDLDVWSIIDKNSLIPQLLDI